MTTVPRPFDVRLWEKIVVDFSPLACWGWTGGSCRHGYGHIAVGRPSRKIVRAHRAAYEMLVGPIPEGLELDHLCRNPSCCNPAHLEPVTHAENMRRGQGGEWAKAKKHCPNGHAYDEENMFREVPNGGPRRCRQCRRVQHRDYKRRRRAMGLPT